MASLAPITYFDFDSAHSVGDAYKAGLPRVPDTMSILRGTVQQIQYVLTNQEFTNWLNASVIFMKEGCQPRKCTSLRCDDCNEACTDPEYLFSSWELQWTCLTLASLAVVWPTLSLHAPTGVLLNDTIQRVGIDDIAAFDGERVFDLMRDCAAVGCEEDNCKVDYLPPTAPDNANLILEPYVSGLMRTCEATEISVSNDIAGPGVIISYAIQTALCVFSWLSIVVVVICRNDARRHIVQPRYRGGARGYEPVENLIPMDPQHKVGSRILHASSTLLVELQEAQCFFIIAVAIAQIYAIFQNAAFSDADSLGGLLYQNDRVVISASLGMQCIALTQAGLRHARLSSFYSLFWATLGATLAGVAGGAVTRSDGELVNKVVDRGGEPGTEQCGGYTSLRQLCVVDPARFDIDGMLMRAASVVGATLLLLWLEALTKLMDGSKRRWSHGKTMAEALDILGTALRVVIPAIFAMFELILLAFTLISCIQMTNPAQVPLKQSWTIGQIIATLFWAPTVSKYGYIVIFGVRTGFEMRMSHDYGVYHKADHAALVDRASKSERAQESQNDGLP